MFVRHLMSSTALSTGPSYRPSDRGVYGQYVEWDLDRVAGVLYRNPLPGMPPVLSLGEHGSSGRLTSAQTRAGVSRNFIFDATNIGLVEPPVASYPFQILNNAISLGLTSSAQIFCNNPALAAPLDAYRVTYFDFVRGQSFTPLTLARTLFASATFPPCGSNGDHLYMLAGSWLGYKQKTSAAWSTTLPASGGRGSRALIPRQIYDEQGIATFLRLGAGGTIEPIPFVAWRRPLTSATRVRAMTINSVSGWSASPRRGKVYMAVRLIVHEIEIGPSTGTGTSNGQAVTFHSMSDHISDYEGFIVIDGTTTSFIMTASGTGDQTIALAQYVNTDGSPSSEFVLAGFGFWSYAAPLATRVGSRPYALTASNILTLPLGTNGAISTAANSPFNVLDLAGALVGTGKHPPVADGFQRILNADVLVSNARTYATCWASYDLGTTWKQIQTWGPRGSVDPAFTDLNRYPTTRELANADRHFYV